MLHLPKLIANVIKITFQTLRHRWLFVTILLCVYIFSMFSTVYNNRFVAADFTRTSADKSDDDEYTLIRRKDNFNSSWILSQNGLLLAQGSLPKMNVVSKNEIMILDKYHAITQSQSIVLQEIGWPVRAFYAIYFPHEADTTLANVSDIGAATFVTQQWDIDINGILSGFPYLPIWSGIAVDGALFIVVILSVCLSIACFQVGARCMKGRCIYCGYKVINQLVCPECGAETTQ